VEGSVGGTVVIRQDGAGLAIVEVVPGCVPPCAAGDLRC